LDIGVLGYIGIVQHKEHSPEVLSIPPGTPCIYLPLGYKPLRDLQNRGVRFIWTRLVTLALPKGNMELQYQRRSCPHAASSW